MNFSIFFVPSFDSVEEEAEGIRGAHTAAALPAAPWFLERRVRQVEVVVDQTTPIDAMPRDRELDGSFTEDEE